MKKLIILFSLLALTLSVSAASILLTPTANPSTNVTAGVYNLPTGDFKLKLNVLYSIKITNMNNSYYYTPGITTGYNLKFKLTSDSTVTLTENSSTSFPNLSIPDSIRVITKDVSVTPNILDTTWYKVTAIDYKAFYTSSNLTSITIPSTVKSIGAAAFMLCGITGNLTIPEGVEFIKDSTFCGCTGLTEIKLPSTLKSIGILSFCSCSHLKLLKLPENVDSLKVNAFSCCDSMRTISLSSNINYISKWAFTYTNPDTIYINGSVVLKTINDSTLFKSASLTDIFSNKTTVVVENEQLYNDYLSEYLSVNNGTGDSITFGYRSANGVVIVPTTAVKETSSDKTFKTYVSNGKLIVKGLNGELLSVYNLQGNAIYNQTTDSDEMELILPSKGVYVVKVNGQTTKVVN